MKTFIVNYWLDNERRTPGKCMTDHRVAKGETIYVAEGRAIVRSCSEVTIVDKTHFHIQGRRDGIPFSTTKGDSK